LDVVADDLVAAAAHYQSWRSDGTEHLLDKYEETVRWIAWNPELFPRIYGRVQRAILKESYFLVYFVQEPDRSLVLAVLDGRRSPHELRSLVTARGRGQN
jgi:plasmid stabilization system protein ParE